MAVTYGFYNSLNGDRTYNAEQMSAIFDGVITDGVFGAIGGALMTIAGTGMQVRVKTGKAWFNSTWTLNDAQMALAVDTADVSLTRIDAVVLEVNSGISTRVNSIKMVKGTPSANPAKPTMVSEEDVHQYALAYITVPANATEITAANIEVNVGKTDCPFVTSVLQQTSITDLFNQWEAEFDTWFANVQAQLAGNVAANLQLQIDGLKIGSTANAQYGLTSSVPNDYIEWIGKYNEYWWSLLHGEAYSYYEETKTPYTFDGSYYYKFYHTDTWKCSYSSKIEINETSGEISLVDPVVYDGKAYADGETMAKELLDAIKGKYVTGLNKNDQYYGSDVTGTNSTIFYIPENATISKINKESDSGTGTIVYSGSATVDINLGWATPTVPAQIVTSTIIQVPAGETTYEHSTNRNAYPDSGMEDGITYTFLGKPFENIVNISKIEMISYIGTDSYGQNGASSITCSFAPDFIFGLFYTTQADARYVYPRPMNNSYQYSCSVIMADLTTEYAQYQGLSTSQSSTTYAKKNQDGKTLTWYSTSSNYVQNNLSTNKYYVLCLKL